MKIVVNNDKIEPSDNGPDSSYAKAYALLSSRSDADFENDPAIRDAFKLVHDLAVLKAVNLLSDNMVSGPGVTIDQAIKKTLDQCRVDPSELRDLKST